MTKQEIFDTVVRGIIKQGGPSVEFGKDRVRCLYRGPNNRKCAAGHLLPDDQFEEKFNSEPVCFIPYFRNMDIDLNWFASLLQMAHDSSVSKLGDEEFFQRWKPKMINLAKKHNLSVTVFEDAINE